MTQQFPSDYKEKAAFGNVTYYFTPQFDATVGVRFSSNDMGVLFSGTGCWPARALPEQTVSDDVQTYLFNARYRPSDDVSLYVRAANGYRPASANLPLINPATGDVLSVPFVKADTLWSYEVGAKGNLAQGVFGYDVAVYLIKWEDLQVFRSFMGVNVGGNADSDVTANGVEATSRTSRRMPSTSRRRSRTRSSELDDDDPSIGGLEGEQLPGIPEWTFSLSGNYDFTLGSLDALRRRRHCVPGSAQHVVQRRRRLRRRGDRPAEPELHDGRLRHRGPADRRHVGSLQAVAVRHEPVRRVRLPAGDDDRHARHGIDRETPHDRRSVHRGVLTRSRAEARPTVASPVGQASA